MCAIVSSRDVDRFKDLVEINRERGTFASSLVKINTNTTISIGRFSGLFDTDTIDNTQIDYFVGHVQAPTSDIREWSAETSHPFETSNWLVFHNGVLTNHKELDSTVKVDTQCIVNLLEEYNDIQSVVNKLKGTFALFIINKKTLERFILRQGSLLHYNDQGDVSSLFIDGMKIIPEGVIMKYSNDSWSEYNKFNTKSPFIFL
jgi:glutamine phosphoribosylpyrophosphate amidotransferase